MQAARRVRVVTEEHARRDGRDGEARHDDRDDGRNAQLRGSEEVVHLDERGRHGLAHDLRHLASDSLVLRDQRPTDVGRAVEDAPRVDERLDAGDDEEDLEHEPSFAVVPVDDDDDDIWKDMLSSTAASSPEARPMFPSR